MAVSFTAGNDFIIPSENGQTYLGGAGNDTYILSGTTVGANATIVIQDTEGTNKIQLVAGLSITSSTVTSNAIELTLSNSAKVQILGAGSFGYDVGGNALGGVVGTQQTFDTFVTGTLGTTIPEQGESPSTGGGVTIPEGGGGGGEDEPTTVNIDTGTPESPVAFNASGGAYEYSDDASVTCPSYLFVLPEIIDNYCIIHYSRSHYGNEDFNIFGLCSVAFKGQKSAT